MYSLNSYNKILLLFFKCSKKCGNGFKVRDVICQQLLALGELANKPDRDCPIGKPEARESCNIQPCLFSDISRIQGGWIHKSLEEMTRQNVSKFTIFYMYEKVSSK